MGRLSQHDGIVTVYDSGYTEHGEPYLIMPLLDGSLDDELEARGSMEWREAVGLMAEVCEIVAYAHEQGVVHRDLKPANLMRAPSGRALVADFGISRITDASASLKSTAITLTPAFSPPEALEAAPAAPSADVYSLGATLYALLAGRPPFMDDRDVSLLALMRKIVEAPIPPMPPGVPEAVGTIVETAMAKNPAERYPDAGHMAGVLRHVVSAEASVPVAPTRSFDTRVVNPSDRGEQPDVEGDSPSLDETAATAVFETHPAGLGPAGSPTGHTTPVPDAGTKPASAHAARPRRPLLVLAPAAVLVAALALAGWLVTRDGKADDTVDAAPPTATNGADTPSAAADGAATSDDVTEAPSAAPIDGEGEAGSLLATSAFADAIIDAGVVRIGINEFLGPPIGGPDGFERALIAELVPRLFGDEISIEFVPLTAADRFVALDDGDIDLLIRNTARTSSREELATFTGSYFLDGLAFAGRPGQAASFTEMSGITLGMLAGTTQQAAATEALSAAGASVTIEPFESLDAMLGAYATGRVDVVGHDFTTLLTFRAAGELDADVLWADVAILPFAAAVRLGEEEFAAEVDEAIVSIIDDGAWLGIYRATIGDEPPYTTEDMRAAPLPPG